MDRGSILIISPWSRLWSLAPGAGVSDESQMLSRLMEHGYDIHMLIPSDRGSMRSENRLRVHKFPNVLGIPTWLPAPVRRLWLLPSFWSVATFHAVRLAKRLQPRLVMGFSNYGALPAERAARAVRVPSVLKLFGVMHAGRLEWPLPRYLYHSLEQVLAFKVPLSHFIVLNDGTRGREVALRWGVPPERLTYLPNGIDTDWAHLQLHRAELRRQHGVGEEAVVFLSLSRLVLSKRVDRILDAVQRARSQAAGAAIEVWIAGDGPLRNDLERQARRLGVSARFLGTASRDEIPHLLGAADALVSTSMLTNMSIPTCEAMVVGCPVVALDVSGTREVVQDGETGLLVPEDDPDALAGALLRLAGDAAFRSRLGDNARRFAASHFMNWDARVAAEIELIDRLVAAAPSRLDPPSLRG